MKVFSVFLTLCTIMALSHAYPHNFTDPSDPYPTTSYHAEGMCEYRRRHCTGLIGEFCPQCDADGNFLPQQCWPSTGHCWCVDIYTGGEIPNTNTPPGVPPVNCGHSGGDDYYYCPHGWSSFRDKCFMFIDTPKKWIEAEVYCQFDDANLVSIQDEEENRFIMSLTRGHTHNFPETWTGGFDAIHPGYWMWSDGSDFTYNNWYEHPYNNNHDDDDDDNDHKNEHEHHDDNDDDDHDNGHKDEHEHHDDNDDDEHDNDHKDEHEHHDDNDSDDDKKDQEAKKKNCLRINYEYDLKWFYASCTDSLPFVCSKKAY